MDVTALIRDGLLDLDEVFRRADWQQIDTIAGADGCVTDVDLDDWHVVLEWAKAYGLVAYRFAVIDDGERVETGPAVLDSDDAVGAGEDLADEYALTM